MDRHLYRHPEDRHVVGSRPAINETMEGVTKNMDRCDEVDAPRNEGLLKHRPVGIAAGRAVTLIGKLDDQRKHWVAECPTQALGS